MIILIRSRISYFFLSSLFIFLSRIVDKRCHFLFSLFPPIEDWGFLVRKIIFFWFGHRHFTLPTHILLHSFPPFLVFFFFFLLCSFRRPLFLKKAFFLNQYFVLNFIFTSLCLCAGVAKLKNKRKGRKKRGKCVESVLKQTDNTPRLLEQKKDILWRGKKSESAERTKKEQNERSLPPFVPPSLLLPPPAPPPIIFCDCFKKLFDVYTSFPFF